MTFLWNWTLPGVCGNLEKGINTSTFSRLVGNLLLGRVCPPQAWGCRRNSHSTGPSTSAVNKTECMIPELVKICFIIAFPRMYFRESLGYFTLPWVSPQDGSFCWCAENISLCWTMGSSPDNREASWGVFSKQHLSSCMGMVVGWTTSVQQKYDSEVEEKSPQSRSRCDRQLSL